MRPLNIHRARHTEFSVTKPILVCIAMMSAACSDRLPTKITCDAVRALNVGMTAGQVRGLLGMPDYLTPGMECGGPGPDSECWDYESPSGSLKLQGVFERDNLVQASVYYTASWHGRSTSLYWLDRSNRSEGPAFTRYVPCSP
jgi:hypothetical protein